MTHKKHLAILLASMFSLALTAGAACASPEAVELKIHLEKTYPNTPISEIKASPVPGLYQVTMGRTVAFADKTGRYFVFGPMFDMVEQVDLTADARNELARAEWETLPLNLAFQVVKGDGSRQFAVFSDPDCSFCKRLESELVKVDNYTMHVFMSPVDALHPDARMKAEAVWCSQDRPGAWKAMMVDGVTPDPIACANPLDQIAALSRELGVAGTPSLIRDDGTFKAGFMPANALEAWLDDSTVRP